MFQEGAVLRLLEFKRLDCSQHSCEAAFLSKVEVPLCLCGVRQIAQRGTYLP